MCGCGTTEWCEGGCDCGCDHGTPSGMYRQGQHFARKYRDMTVRATDAYAQGQRDALASVVESHDLTYNKGQRDMLARCVAAVEALPLADEHGNLTGPEVRARTLAALRALGGGDEM